MFWQVSFFDNRIMVPSIIPSPYPIYPVHSSSNMFMNQPHLGSIPFNPYMQSAPSYVFVPHIGTPPLEHCRNCSSTYICPHHFKNSILATVFCCHYCYTFHTFPSMSSR